MKNLYHKPIGRLPLNQLWDSVGPFGDRIRDLTSDEAAELVFTRSPAVAVATLGAPLRWIPTAEIKNFWEKVQANVVRETDDEGFELADYPGGSALVASLWWDRENRLVVLLEEYH